MGQIFPMNTPLPRFKDRADAARRIAAALAPYRDRRPLVLGLPPGGILLADVLAQELGGDLDVALVHPLGEAARPVGAIAENGTRFLCDGSRGAVAPQQLQTEADAALEELRRLRQKFSPQSLSLNPSGRLAILVDDGTAAEVVLTTALLSLRDAGAECVIAATAVAGIQATEALRREADVVVCLRSLGPLLSAAAHFEQFDVAADKEIREALRKASRKPYTRGAG